jgi:hypothetical protein
VDGLGLAIPVLLWRPVIVCPCSFAKEPFRPRIFLPGLLRGFDAHFFRVILGYFSLSDRYVFGHYGSLCRLTLIDRKLVTGPFDIDIYVALGLNTASEKKVESKDREQDNDHDGH